MLQSRILLIVFIIMALTAVTSLAARRLRVPQSILLVLMGAAVAFAPGFARISLPPDLVLLVLLPPLLYTSGVGMSWRGFKRNLRPIMLLAVGCVLFTASAVAAATHWLLHLPWAVGFVLGAVVSPPDAVAPMAIARRLEEVSEDRNYRFESTDVAAAAENVVDYLRRLAERRTVYPDFCCTSTERKSV